ncbi:MAG: MOSC N-terminal beta barrel domain-containing protein [Actinomycetota bacterium]
MTSEGGSTAGTLSAIHVYPIKSCRAVELDRVEVTRRGLAGDRLFQVIDEQTTPVTQRQEPTLATVQPTVIDGGLRLHAEGRPPLEIAAPTSNDTAATSLLGLPVEAADVGDQAAAWFTDLLGSPVRLVGVTDETEYMVPFPDGEMHLGWADGSSILVANSASHRWLADRADEPFGMDRFRPNLTVDADPWAEDTWRELSVGAARLGVGLAWPRCAIPQVDQVDGSRHREPAKVLKAHRWCPDASAAPEPLRPLLEGNALFGIGCSVETAGVEVAAGDEIVVHRTGVRVIDPPFAD